MAARWQRPAALPLPTVYRRYEGPRAMPDGRKPNFWIQDVTPDRDDEVVDFMCDSFLKEEHFCASTHVLADPVSVQEIRAIWREKVQQRAALMALTDWPDGPAPARPRLAGCNITCVSHPDEPLAEVRGAPLRKVLRGLHDVEARVDAFALFGADALLNALGLSVAPAFRGQQLGRELLEARAALALGLGLRLTLTVFTGAAAQKQSARAGFQLLAEQRYDEYVDEDGRQIFPGATCDTFQLKAKRY